MSLVPEESATESRVHFTYKSNPDMNSLCQGDILKITDELKEVLTTVHPYFKNEQYKYFMVLTQSCDLVRREKKICKTPYITLAAVRCFSEFFEKLLISKKYAESNNGYLLMDSKQQSGAYQLLERIYNNTEPDYFFLYKEDLLDFPESMIASLKVSIALKSELHYDACLRAKHLELSDEFKAKLGWLVGNIYSRVGTTDWESILTPPQRKSMLTEELQSHCIIGSKEQIRILKKELANNAESLQTQEAVANFILGCPIETPYDKMIKILEDVVRTSSNDIPQKEKETLIKTIKSRQALKVLFPNQ